jgi:carbon monoxide dehydrogenase subunit G
MKINVAVDIDATADAIWRVIEPIERHVDWMADAESITFTGEQTQGLGTSFDCVTKVGPLRTVDRMVVTEWDPPRVMAIEHRGLVRGRGRFEIADGCFRWVEILQFPWWLAAPVLRAIWRRHLRRLKQIVESA